jgi:glycosyltransferase involved in cell wall biosynthesis
MQIRKAKHNASIESGSIIAYFVTEDWYFCSHRLPLAVAAKEAGYTVYVVTRVSSHGAEIEAAGLNLIPITLSRRSKNPIIEAMFIWRLIRIYREIRPDIVHHVAMKPVIYGSIAARLVRVSAQVNAMAGLGFLFSSKKLTARLLRPLVKALFRLLLNNERTAVILQNPDDVEVMVGSGTVGRDRVRLIVGSGVDTEEYRWHPEPGGAPVVLLASRLLWDKGVGEFVKAARLLKREGAGARFVLVGEGDDANPESISKYQLETWAKEGDIEWWGRRSDMPSVLSGSQIVCLPSYREGLPKVLVEAASCGRPIVTTDAPGCREIVRDGVNGILVPVKDVDSLANAIRTLLNAPEMRMRMGQSGRQLVKERFSMEQVIGETLAVYRAMLQ